MPSRKMVVVCRDRLGIPPQLRGALTGFTHRATAALAHLRDCWMLVDPRDGNGVAIAAAMRLVLEAPAMERQRELAVMVLLHDLEPEQKTRLAIQVGLKVEQLGGGHGS